MAAARASLRPWLSPNGFAPLTGMLSVWPTTVTVPISSWFSAITWPIEAISGSKPSVSSARADWNSSGSAHWMTRRASDGLSSPLSAGSRPAGRAGGELRQEREAAGLGGGCGRRRGVARRAVDLGALGRRQAAGEDDELVGLAGEAQRQPEVDRGGGDHGAGEQHPERHGEAAGRVGGDDALPVRRERACAASGLRSRLAAAVRTAASERSPARPGTR